MYFELRETIINQDTCVQVDIGALNYSLDVVALEEMTTNSPFLLFVHIKIRKCFRTL